MKYSVKSLTEELKSEDISNRSFFITGGNSGFGFLVAKMLLQAGGKVTIGCRSQERAITACNTLKEETGNESINYLIVDMSDAASIRSCVETIRSQGIRFNVLVNNAGVSLIPNYTEAPTGQELTCQTNYFGVVQLTESLIPLLEGDARVIFVSSLTYNKGAPDTIDRTHLCIGQEAYDKWNPYFRSKYLVTSYAQYLARRNPSLFVIACDPGIAGTAIARELGCIGKIFQWKICQCFFPTWKGACTIAFAAASQKVKSVCKSGDMCCCCKKKELIPRVKSEEEQNQIFEATKDILDSMPCCVC